MIPSPTDLNYFIEIANLNNLSRAAEALGISQPSLTLAVQRLEESVGTKILIRHKRGVCLTKAGKQLLAHARQLLQQWETIKSKTLASVDDIQGSFTIGCHTSVALYCLPGVLPNLLEKYPQLEIKLSHDISRKIPDQIMNFSVDIGIVVNPAKHPDLVIKKLEDDKITLWQGSSGRQIQNIHSGRAIIICDPELTQTQSLIKQMRKQGINYARILPTSSLEVVADLTAKGCGIGILPEKLAAKHGNLTRIPKSPFYADEICLLYHGENRNIKGIQAIAEAIKSVYKKA